MAARMALCLVAALALGWFHTAVGQFECSQSEMTVEAVEDCVNSVRSDPGRYAAEMCGADAPSGTLWPDSALTSAAQFHNSDMAARGYFDHGDFSGRIRGAGFAGGEIGENLANGYSSAYAVVAGWMCSPGHRRNLVNCNYDSMGTAVDCVNGMSGGCLVTQTYGCSSGNCCGGGGRGPAPAHKGKADEADAEAQAPAPAQNGLFRGGFFSNIFGAPTGPAPQVQGEIAERPAESADVGQAESTDAGQAESTPRKCVFQFMCRLFGP